MNSGDWRYAAASVIGTSHVKLNTPCQDANSCLLACTQAEENVMVAVISDGAGSASHAEEGSALVCSAISAFVNDHFAGGSCVEQITKDLALSWLQNIRGQIDRRAESANCKARDYACTLLAAIVGQNCAVFLQIGDGAIVVLDEEQKEYGHVFWPERGEYENTTFFITQDDASLNLLFEIVPHSVDEIALFSDGLQRLALDYKACMPHGPFFRGLFAPLRNVQPGRSEQLSRALLEFLGSPRVNAKTDDDKTLIMATRLPQETNTSV